MSYDGRAIANFVLDFCEAKQRGISNLSLQKIVFFCHAWSLIQLKRPLVKHQFEAWQYGPVLQYLYHEFSAFDRESIRGRAKSIDPTTGNRQVVEYGFDEETRALLEKVVGFYSELSAGELVRLSHAKGGPWHSVWSHQERVNPGMKIGNLSIVEFYSKMRAPFSVQ